MTGIVCLDKDFIKVDVIVFKLIVSACVLDRLLLFFLERSEEELIG